MTDRPAELYLGGLRVGCALIDPGGLTPGEWAALADRAAEEFRAPLAMMRAAGPAPAGWILLRRGFARPVSAPPEPLGPLDAAHRAAMRGLYGLFAGRFPGMPVREDPEEWDARLAQLRPLGLLEGGRLLLWLAEEGGILLELAAAPDAMNRIPGALAAAGVFRAPAPILGVPAEEFDESLKLRLVRPFHLPGARIETPEDLARAADGAVQWDG